MPVPCHLPLGCFPPGAGQSFLPALRGTSRVLGCRPVTTTTLPRLRDLWQTLARRLPHLPFSAAVATGQKSTFLSVLNTDLKEKDSRTLHPAGQRRAIEGHGHAPLGVRVCVCLHAGRHIPRGRLCGALRHPLP